MNNKAIVNDITPVLISTLFENFNREGIDYCVLRNYENLPEDHGNDIDILVKPGDISLAKSVVEKCACQYGLLHIATTERFGYCGYYLLAANCSGKPLLIDLYTGVFSKGRPYASVTQIMQHKIVYKSFWVVPPGIESATVLLKELLMFGKVKSRNNAKKRITKLAKDDNCNFLKCLDPYFGRIRALWLLRLVNEGCWEGIESQYRSLRRTATLNAMKHPVRQICYWFRFLIGHIIYKFKCPLGLFVVLLGPDGSGKTTICNKLEESWKHSFSNECVKIHGDFKILPQLKIIRQLWAKLTKKKVRPDIDFTKRHSGSSVKPHSAFKSLCYLAYYIWDYFLGHLTVFWNKGKDRLIIADRYYYDYFFQLRNDRLPKRILWFFHLFVPKPDLVVYLERDPEQIYNMKDELEVGEICRQQEILRLLVKKLPNAANVDANDGVDATVDRVMREIYKKMAKGV